MKEQDNLFCDPPGLVIGISSFLTGSKSSLNLTLPGKMLIVFDI